MKIIEIEQAINFEVFYVALEPVFNNEMLANSGERDELAGVIYGNIEDAKAGLEIEQEKLREWNANHAAHNGFEYHEKEAHLPIKDRLIDYDLPADLAIFGGYVNRSDSNDD